FRESAGALQDHNGPVPQDNRADTECGPRFPRTARPGDFFSKARDRASPMLHHLLVRKRSQMIPDAGASDSPTLARPELDVGRARDFVENGFERSGCGEIAQLE